MIDCNHTYVETDAKGTIECTECGITSSVEYPQREGTAYYNTEARINELVEARKAKEVETMIRKTNDAMGETCRNGKTWAVCFKTNCC